MSDKPMNRILLKIEGGVLKEAYSDVPVELYLVDMDVEGCEPSDLLLIDGERASVEYSVLSDEAGQIDQFITAYEHAEQPEDEQ